MHKMFFSSSLLTNTYIHIPEHVKGSLGLKMEERTKWYKGVKRNNGREKVK